MTATLSDVRRGVLHDEPPAGDQPPDGGAPQGRFRRYVSGITGGGPILPLIVLTIGYGMDEFDTAAFGVLAPTIQKVFDLSDERFGLIVILNLSFVLLLAIPIGYIGDRIPRKYLTVTGMLIAGLFSLCTGLAGAVSWLIGARIGNGVGNLINTTIHRSLLSDYYTPEARPRVFAWHNNGQYVGSIVGPALAGVLSSAFGWRWAFGVLFVPMLLAAVGMLKLKEPLRGATDDPNSAEALERAEAIAFPEAVRILWGVPTLRRQYFSFALIGAGVLPLAFTLPMYYEEVFGIGDLGRGIIFAIAAGVQLVGVTISGRKTQKWLAKNLGDPIKWCGLTIVSLGVALLITSILTNVVAAFIVSNIGYFIVGFFYPPFLTTQALVSPARVRTLSFGFGSLFLVAGVWALWLIPGVAGISDDHGIRWGLAALTPYFIIGGLVLSSARSFVAKDTMQALSNMAVTLALREERRKAGALSLLVSRGVEVSYGQTQVLFGVDFDVRQGEIVALLGTNGAGKSTLLKAICGNINPQGGAIFYDGRDISRLTAPEIAGLGIAMVPGGKGVFPTLTVEENFQLASWLYRKSPEHIEEATEQALRYFPVLRERWEQKAGNLSGGEQQMLLIGMALLAKPRLLMIDELSLGLAPLIVERLLEVVREINQSGVTVILVEQSVNVALTLADRAVFLEKGEVRFDGPTGDLLDRPDILRSVFLEGAAAAEAAHEIGLPTHEAEGNGHAGGPNGSTNDLQTGLSSGLAVERTPYVIPTDRKGRPKRPMLAVRDLSVAFGGIKAVNGVDLDVYEGQIVGLIGPNGAGKTTIFDLISGFLVPTSGQILLGGRDVTGFTADARARLGLGRSFQDARLFPSMTVRETISVALERHLRVKDPLAAVFGSPATRAEEKRIAKKVDHLIKLMRLQAFENKFISELSTGSRRIVDLACTLAHEPIVLLLDEPSSGIAQRETEALGPLLLDIRDETGAALVVIEHDMPLITSVSDEMVALELGSVMVRGNPQDVVSDPHVVASYLGTTEATINRSGDLNQPIQASQN